MTNKQRTERLTDEELEDLICELEAAGFYRRQLIGLAELQERRKADSAELVSVGLRSICPQCNKTRNTSCECYGKNGAHND